MPLDRGCSDDREPNGLFSGPLHVPTRFCSEPSQPVGLLNWNRAIHLLYFPFHHCTVDTGTKIILLLARLFTDPGQWRRRRRLMLPSYIQPASQSNPSTNINMVTRVSMGDVSLYVHLLFVCSTIRRLSCCYLFAAGSTTCKTSLRCL